MRRHTVERDTRPLDRVEDYRARLLKGVPHGDSSRRTRSHHGGLTGSAIRSKILTIAAIIGRLCAMRNRKSSGMRSVGKSVPWATRGGSGQLPGKKPGSDARGEIPSDPGAPHIVVMLVYLDEAYEQRVREGRMATVHDLREAIMEGAVQRVRPKMMTVAAIMGGLLPIMWTTGTGADIMKRIAAPMIGGMVSSTILTLLVIPVLYALWRGWSLPNSRHVESLVGVRTFSPICGRSRLLNQTRGERTNN